LCPISKRGESKNIQKQSSARKGEGREGLKVVREKTTLGKKKKFTSPPPKILPEKRAGLISDLSSSGLKERDHLTRGLAPKLLLERPTLQPPPGGKKTLRGVNSWGLLTRKGKVSSSFQKEGNSISLSRKRSMGENERRLALKHVSKERVGAEFWGKISGTEASPPSEEGGKKRGPEGA